ncbi:MAG: hypothetical protein FWD52_06335 [Candidatus Bathyarchaeota archaeon]|nr:hypothetical protein [Candidatus Termiticorpusculum sp.]
MAYSRWTECDWYIFGCDEKDGVMFQGPNCDKHIPGDAIDVFIYKLFDETQSGGEDFWKRYNRGKQLIEQNKKSPP